MPRLSEIPKSEVSDAYVLGLYNMLFGDRDPVTEPGTGTGTPGNWWTVFAQVPDAFKHITEGFGFYRSSKRKLDEQYRELAQTRVGYATGSNFVYSQHMKAARFSGISEEKLHSIASWNTATCFDEAERAILAYTDALALEHGRVPEALFATLQRHLSEVEIIELTYITCTYMMHGIMSRALRLELDDVDEPVRETPAPEGTTAEMMGMVDKRKKD